MCLYKSCAGFCRIYDQLLGVAYLGGRCFYPTQSCFIPNILRRIVWHWHWHGRFPLASRFVQHPTWIWLRRIKRIAHRVVCVTDASVVKTLRCAACAVHAAVSVITRLHPSPTQQRSAERRTDCAILYAVARGVGVVYYDDPRNDAVYKFCKVCHAITT